MLDAPLDAVWAFHADARLGLKELSPPGAGVEIVRVDEPLRVGSEVHITARTPIGRRPWTAVYKEFQPPVGSRPHRQAWFVDVARKSPFKRWEHRHQFEEVADGGRVRVQMTDRVDYRVPLGPLGVAANLLLVRPQLKAMFEHRHSVLLERFGGRRVL